MKAIITLSIWQLNTTECNKLWILIELNEKKKTKTNHEKPVPKFSIHSKIVFVKIYVSNFRCLSPRYTNDPKRKEKTTTINSLMGQILANFAVSGSLVERSFAIGIFAVVQFCGYQSR